jgi:hypothetical protein
MTRLTKSPRRKQKEIPASSGSIRKICIICGVILVCFIGAGLILNFMNRSMSEIRRLNDLKSFGLSVQNVYDKGVRPTPESVRAEIAWAMSEDEYRMFLQNHVILWDEMPETMGDLKYPSSATVVAYDSTSFVKERSKIPTLFLDGSTLTARYHELVSLLDQQRSKPISTR